MTRLLPAALSVVLSVQVLLAQAPATRTGADSAVTVAPGDILRVSVWPDSMLGGRFPVEDNGTITVPEVGELHVAGKDIKEIRATLRDLYGQVRKTPIVSVTPIFRIGVLGQVQRPGLYEVDATMTWFDVISLAGGFAGAAARDRVTVIRRGQEILINGAANDAATMSSLSVQVRSGDKVIVPERNQPHWGVVLSVAQLVAVLVTIGLQLRR